MNNIFRLTCLLACAWSAMAAQEFTLCTGDDYQRCGNLESNGVPSIYICHYDASGKAPNTLCVAESSVGTHIGNVNKQKETGDDYCGACLTPAPTTSTPAPTFSSAHPTDATAEPTAVPVTPKPTVDCTPRVECTGEEEGTHVYICTVAGNTECVLESDLSDMEFNEGPGQEVDHCGPCITPGPTAGTAAPTVEWCEKTPCDDNNPDKFYACTGGRYEICIDDSAIDQFTVASGEVACGRCPSTPSPTETASIERSPNASPNAPPPPPSKPSPAPVPSPSGSNGDPHFKTWENEHFEYHGQCDLVLAKDPDFADGLGIDVQIRTKLVRFWSYIHRAAIRIGNDILEIQGTGELEDLSTAHYWVNFEYQGELSTIGGFPVTLRLHEINDKKRFYEIDLSSKYPGAKIAITCFREFIRVEFEGHTAESFGNVEGMLGHYKTGKTLARDGVTEIHDFTKLGNEWQVLPVEHMLFHDIAEPQFPKKCIEPEDPQGERRRRLAEASVTQEQAEAACASIKDPLDRKDCIYDILATQDLDMVGAF